MLFTSFTFLCFFALYYWIHRMLPVKLRIALIILGGLVFYACWRVEDLWVPLYLTGAGYSGAIWTSRSTSSAQRLTRLWLSLSLILAPLFVFKYSNQDLPLPLGISFITFTVIAYVVDAYRHDAALERRPHALSGLILFFPHLIAGPILRTRELIPQLSRKARGWGIRLYFGLSLFTIGVLKKVVFADPIAKVIDPLFASPGAWDGLSCLLAIYGFSMQIYMDFSGYSDMAIGLAISLGIRLPQNFARPYTAATLVEYWRRWHITLSRWLRDYIYIPLGGNRQGPFAQSCAIIATMGLGGLWHGASWTYLCWGGMHGLAISAIHLRRRLGLLSSISLWPRWILVLGTFHFVAVSRVFFRSSSVSDALSLLSGMGRITESNVLHLGTVYAFPLLLLTIFFLTHRFDDHRQIRSLVQRTSPIVLWPLLVAIWLLAIAMQSDHPARFIYFDF